MRFIMTVSGGGAPRPGVGTPTPDWHRRLELTITAGRGRDDGPDRRTPVRGFRTYLSSFLRHARYREFL